MKDINKVLVISLSNIGDVILTLPVIGTLRHKFPQAEISILVGVRAAEVVKDNPEFSEVIIYDKHQGWKEKIQFIKKLRRQCYDLVIDLRHSLFPLFLKTRYQSSIFHRGYNSGEHRVKKHLSSLDEFGFKTDKIRFPFYITAQAKETVKRIVEAETNGDLIVINPTAASHLKCWGDEHFISLSQRIQGISDSTIVIVGAETDREKCLKISGEINNSLNLGGKLNFQELAALLEQAGIFITNDSGPLHLASALGVPTLAIFGPTDPVKYGPLSKISRVVRRELFCSPCELAQCPREHQCMQSISADEIFSAFKEIINEKKHS